MVALLCRLRGLGGARFNHNYHYCPLCRANKEDFVILEGFSQDAFPYAEKTYDEVDEACRVCEIVLVLTAILHQQIRTRLGYDRTKKGYHGRYLMEGIPGTNLEIGDRLEPSWEIPDTGAGFDNLCVFPITATFWRSSRETWVYHRNPLWNRRMGFTHDRCMAVDWLHSLSLGVFQFFVMAAIHILLQADVWETKETTEEARNAASIDRIRAELTEFYRSQKKKGINVTEITDLAPSTFGTARSPGCHLKAAETNHFMPYLDNLLARFSAVLPDPRGWQQASASLLKCLALIREHPQVFPVDAAEECPPRTSRVERGLFSSAPPSSTPPRFPPPPPARDQIRTHKHIQQARRRAKKKRLQLPRKGNKGNNRKKRYPRPPLSPRPSKDTN